MSLVEEKNTAINEMEDEIKKFKEKCSEHAGEMVYDRLIELRDNPRDYSIKDVTFICEILDSSNSDNLTRLINVFEVPLQIATEKWLSTLYTLPKQTEHSEVEKSVKLIQKKREVFGTCMREIVEVKAKTLIDNGFLYSVNLID